MRQTDLNKKVELLGCDVNKLTMDSALEYSQNLIAAGGTGHVATVNVSMLMAMRKDPELKQYIQNSELTLADGQPLIWLSRILGTPLNGRVAGIDYCAEVIKLAAQKNYKVCLLGATQCVNRKVQNKFKNLYPDLEIVGSRDGYFSAHEAGAAAQMIADSGADILIVAMGSPRQEDFIQSHWKTLGVKLAIPVGGSFDVWAGLRKRAPIWMQQAGLEWVYRMSQEFRRLAPRYAITNTQFLWHASAALFQLKFPKGLRIFMPKSKGENI